MSAPGRLPVDDELFRPTIVDVPRPVPAPFRVVSLFYVGVLAGPYACTAVALLNGLRLGVTARVQAQVLALGALGVVVLLLLARSGVSAAEQYAITVPGLLSSFAQTRLLRPRERYWSGRGVEPASQVVVGLVAGLVGLALALLSMQLSKPALSTPALSTPALSTPALSTP